MNPFAGAASLSSAWRAERSRLYDIRRQAVPTEAMVRSAYECDEIDSFEIEWLMEAAVFGRCVELPARMASLRLAQYHPKPWKSL